MPTDTWSEDCARGLPTSILVGAAPRACCRSCCWSLAVLLCSGRTGTPGMQQLSNARTKICERCHDQGPGQKDRDVCIQL